MDKMGMKTKMVTAFLAMNMKTDREIISQVAYLTSLDKNQVSGLAKTIKDQAWRAFAPEYLDMVISALAAERPLTFVQVGANDGKTADPVFKHINRYAKRALLIEPIPHNIPLLKESYKDFSGELHIRQEAIGPVGDDLVLYILGKDRWDEYIARWGRHPLLITSFDPKAVRNRVAKRLGISRKEAMAALDAVTLTPQPLHKVMEENGFSQVDILQVDAEGYDVDVIETLADYRPLVINFESFNLSPDRWARWKEISEAWGYGYVQGKTDTIAIKGANFRVDYL